MRTTAFGTAFTLLLATSLAHGEDDRPSDDGARVAPKNALELTLGNGFSQGFGSPDSRTNTLADLTRGGLSTQLGISLRVSPEWAFGTYGEGARYFAAAGMPDGTVGYGAAFGVQAMWFAAPYSQINPWLGLGTGFRGYWVDLPKGHESLHGYDLVRLRLGADYRLGPSTSVGPMLGATLTLFDTHRDAETNDVRSTKDPEVTAFLFAGFQGRFEIGGQRVREPGSRIARR
ncbi:MAG TPA: hypothetical protein VFZ53_31330 [Polyangiaceae bacterium]